MIRKATAPEDDDDDVGTTETGTEVLREADVGEGKVEKEAEERLIKMKEYCSDPIVLLKGIYKSEEDCLKTVFGIEGSIDLSLVEKYKQFESLFEKYSKENLPIKWQQEDFKALLIAIAQKESNLGYPSDDWLMGFKKGDEKYKGAEKQIEYASAMLKAGLETRGSRYEDCDPFNPLKCVLSIYKTDKSPGALIFGNQEGKKYAKEVMEIWEDWKIYFALRNYIERYDLFREIFEKYSKSSLKGGNLPEDWDQNGFKALLVAVGQKQSNLEDGDWLMGYGIGNEKYKGADNQVKYASAVLKNALEVRNSEERGNYEICSPLPLNSYLKCVLSFYHTGKPPGSFLFRNKEGIEYANDVLEIWENWKAYFGETAEEKWELCKIYDPFSKPSRTWYECHESCTEGTMDYVFANYIVTKTNVYSSRDECVLQKE